MVSILNPLIRCLEKIYIASFDIKAGGSHTFQCSICDKYLDTIDSHLKRRFPDVDLLESFGILWSHASGELASHFTSSLVTLPEIKVEWEQLLHPESLPFCSVAAHMRGRFRNRVSMPPNAA